MNAMWSEAKAGVSHRLATHLSVGPFRLLNETPGVSFAFDDIPKSAATNPALTYNGWLISHTHDVAARPGAYRCSLGLMSRALEAASKRRIRIPNLAEALPCAGI